MHEKMSLRMGWEVGRGLFCREGSRVCWSAPSTVGVLSILSGGQWRI
jgi:hypothetical protein